MDRDELYIERNKCDSGPAAVVRQRFLPPLKKSTFVGLLDLQNLYRCIEMVVNYLALWVFLLSTVIVFGIIRMQGLITESYATCPVDEARIFYIFNRIREP